MQRDTLGGCSDGVTKLQIRNVSENVVWIIDGGEWRSASGLPQIDLFRSYVAYVTKKEAGNQNAPVPMTLEPGVTANLRPGARVRLYLDPSVQAAWSGYDLIVDTAFEKGVDFVDDTIRKRRTVPAMMYTCFRAGWETGKVVDEFRADPDQQLRNEAFVKGSTDGLESGFNCAGHIREVADEAKRTRTSRPVELLSLQVKTSPGSVWSRTLKPVFLLARRGAATLGR